MDPFPPEALLDAHSPAHRDIANALRAIVTRVVPTAIERVRPGWGLIGYDVPVGRRTRYFAWIWLQPEHVHLGFQNGVLMEDADGLLQGAGITKQVRWLTLNSLDEIDEAAFAAFVLESVRVAVMSRSERVAVLVDREERQTEG